MFERFRKFTKAEQVFILLYVALWFFAVFLDVPLNG